MVPAPLVEHPLTGGLAERLVTEAGGRFTTLDGDETLHGGSGVSTNGLLHETVLGALTGA